VLQTVAITSCQPLYDKGECIFKVRYVDKDLNFCELMCGIQQLHSSECTDDDNYVLYVQQHKTCPEAHPVSYPLGMGGGLFPWG
jgi:hypothetical protein